jgi:uracil-DNA glycosylase family 4
MDRTQAFIEYGRILEDAEDWLSAGYRTSRGPITVMPPAAGETAGSDTAVSDTAARRNENVEFEPRPPHPEDSASAADLVAIAAEAASCRACNLHLTRANTVPGIGGTDVTLMVITPPPADGAGEDMSPLAPYEAEYLGKWLTALGLNPATDMFITPAVKCRTPGGRPPSRAETESCSLFLRRQYKAVNPRAVLALGAAACGALTGDGSDFPSLVGRDWIWGSVPALVLWTPAEVLANPERLRKPVWDGLQRLKAAWNAVPRTGV